jgi:hypothetical protein
MSKLSFEISKPRYIEINEQRFEVLMTDLEIMERTQAMYDNYTEISANPVGLGEVITAVKAVTSFVDEILGEGAVSRITGNKPLGAADALRLMALVARNAAEAYSEAARDEYDD